MTILFMTFVSQTKSYKKMKACTAFYAILSVTTIALLSACTRQQQNAVYYWRTTFKLDNTERDFLKEHKISRMYIRYFDVVPAGEQARISHNLKIEPSATIQFLDSIPRQVEIVPVVFITIESIRQISNEETEYARRIVKRIKAISHKQGIDIDEIQLDCDWTAETQPIFFNLCRHVRELLEKDSISLSSTIRLHQLTGDTPPVDRGVLMVYNTGAIKNISTQNSIFNPHDIMPYLKDGRLSRYPLPLDVAYPVYGWSVAFDPKGNFKRLIRQTNFSPQDNFKATGKNTYKVTSYCDLEGIYYNDVIRVEIPSYWDIERIKRIIEKQLFDKPHGNIIYHLDSKQLSKFSSHEIDQIYHLN